MPGAIPEVHDTLEAIAPGRDGEWPGNALWLLHDLSIIDKHRLLMTTVARAEGLALNLGSSPLMRDHGGFLAEVILNSDPEPIEVGLEVYSEPLDAQAPFSARAVIDVVFDEGPAANESVMQTLMNSRDAVHQTVALLAVYL